MKADAPRAPAQSPPTGREPPRRQSPRLAPLHGPTEEARPRPSKRSSSAPTGHQQQQSPVLPQRDLRPGTLGSVASGRAETRPTVTSGPPTAPRTALPCDSEAHSICRGCDVPLGAT